MIEVLDRFAANIAAFACRGHVTFEDYETILVPAIERKLKHHEKLRIYYEIGADFGGIDPGAMWEDLKVGMGHLSHWERIAVVTDVEWIRLVMKAFGFLIPAEIKLFALKDTRKARRWIAGGNLLHWR